VSDLRQKQIDQTSHGDQTTLLPSGLLPSDKWGELRIPVGTSLPPKEYISDEFELLWSFRVDEGWTSEGQGHDYLQLAYGDAQLSIVNPHAVYKPDVLTEPTVAPENVENLVAWFQKHPHLHADKTVSTTYGGWSGKGFDMTADAPPGLGFLECTDPCVPIFPLMEDGRIVFFEGYKIQTSVSEVEGEPVVVTIQSPPNEFDEFLPRATEVVKTVEWRRER
jgi:hypothetical protein